MNRTTVQKSLLKTQLFSVFVHLSLCSLAAFTISCTSSEASTQTKTRTINTQSNETASENQYRLGEQAPDFSLPDLDGTTRKLSDLRGKHVVIHFATTWCPFCNAEAPHLEQLYQNYQSKGVEVFIIDVKEPKELVQQKLQDRFNFTFPVLLDSDGAISTAYAPEGVLPDLARDEVALASNLIIDAEGRIQFYSLLNSQNFDAELLDLQARLDEIL